MLHHHHHHTREMNGKMLQQLMIRSSTQLFPFFQCNFINLSICASIITVTLKHVLSVSTSEMWSTANYFMLSIPLYTINRNQKQSKFKIKYQWFHNRNDIAEYSDIVTKWIYHYLTNNFLFHERLDIVLQNAQHFLQIALVWGQLSWCR
jgi:hypothetical protein